jgi:hypothetical protein
VNKKELADIAVEFIRIDEVNNEELERLEKLNVLIKDKHIPIANLGMFKTSQVVQKVEERLPHRFTQSSHTSAWKHFNIRPKSGSAKPEITDARYCVFDSAHHDYLYTQAWIDKLLAELSDPQGFLTITGFPVMAKKAKPTATSSPLPGAPSVLATP